MKTNRFAGLLAALSIALVTSLLAAGGITPPPEAPVARAGVPPISPTATPRPTLPAPSPTVRPTTPTPTPTLPPTLTPTPSPTSLPTATPTSTSDPGLVIGHSIQGRPLVAYRIGRGAIKVVLVGNIHGAAEANTYLLARQLLAYFQAHPDQVPPEVSLWILPTMNPDGLATGHRWNAHDVDLNRNADTDLDGCAGNDWSPDPVGLEGEHPGAGGPYPFSEPETVAVRDFLQDAWVAVFYHSAAGAIFADTCQRHVPSVRLAQILSAATGYPVPEEGWTGYPLSGEFGDYLAGEGVAAVTVELTDHEAIEFERNLAGVQALLAGMDTIVGSEAAQVDAELVWLSTDNTGVWRYAENSFIHPIALEVMSDTAYLLDGGRVLALDLVTPAPPRLLLAPGDDVEGVRVLEPLDLATDGEALLALDRAGDVYRYDTATKDWSVERYDRPVRDTSDHYFVALAAEGRARYLLDTTHEQVWRYTKGQMGTAWAKLPRSHDVDLSADGDSVYVLTRAMNAPQGSLLRYRNAAQVSSFQPNIEPMHPRQVVATSAALYVLDRAGRRLLALDPQSGALQTLYQFTDRRAVSAFWAGPSGERLILAGRDTLYFYGQPELQAAIIGGPVLQGPQPHDPALLEGLRGLQMPIAGAHLTGRDFQLPGAPRHYRLGLHEGLDFYGNTVGVTVNRSTPVRAVADGVVVRALVDYQPLTAAQSEAWAAECRRLGYTPPEVLDGYRGMQVWIDHGGLVSRYAHLSSIAPGIAEGTAVTQGQIIGTVGNSGTPSSAYSQTEEVHLHLELWVRDHFIGQFLRPIESREWLERILR